MRTIDKKEIIRCVDCDEFRLEKHFSGPEGTRAEDEYNSIGVDECPACGSLVESVVEDIE